MSLLEVDLTSAELGVLGAVIATKGECLDDIALVGDDFNDKRHGDLFDLMVSRYGRGESVDPISLAATSKAFDPVFMHQLSEHGRFAYAVGEHADIVSRHGQARRLRAVGDGLHQMNESMPLEVMRERAQGLLDQALGQQKSKVRMLADIVPGVLDSMRREDTYVPSPWPKLDMLIGGFRPGAVYVVGARPGVGKTVIALQIAQSLAQHGHVSFSSLEMSEEELVKRILSERLAIPMQRAANNELNAADWEKIATYNNRVTANIAFDTRATMGPSGIREHARQVSRRSPLAGVVVDYLQLMSSSGPKGKRYDDVSEFSRQMKLMAKDLEVPVVVLSQLNRDSEKGGTSTPRLSDLRDSGAIEQDADVVILLSRDTSEDVSSVGVIELDVAKNRHGKTGVVRLAWQGHYSRAVEMAMP